MLGCGRRPHPGKGGKVVEDIGLHAPGSRLRTLMNKVDGFTFFYLAFLFMEMGDK